MLNPEPVQPKTPLILASGSPRRRELLRQAGYRFRVCVPPVDDRAAGPSENPERLAEAVAGGKTRSAILAHGLKTGLVLGADTIVVLGNLVLGKPDDEADARRILSTLSGTEHRVITGVALANASTDRILLAHDVTGVRMRRMTEAEIDAYVASGEGLGKAGAYAIQETGDRFVERLEGSLTNVVGLPMELLERMLAAAGYNPGDFKG
jgi:septum formation protein